MQEINAIGGINGRTIELIERDDQANNELGAKIASELTRMKVAAKSATKSPSEVSYFLDVDHVGASGCFTFTELFKFILDLHLHEAKPRSINRSKSEQG